ncbi:putative ferroportin-1 [Helianthus anomalus]
MTATLEWDGILAYIIGTCRGISAIIGISATFFVPFNGDSNLNPSNWTLVNLWTCLLVCVGSIWMQNSTTSVYLLMVGVVASRLGLQMLNFFAKVGGLNPKRVPLGGLEYCLHL